MCLPHSVLSPGAPAPPTSQEGLDDGPDFLSDEDRGVSSASYSLAGPSFPRLGPGVWCASGSWPRGTPSPPASFLSPRRPAPRPSAALPPSGTLGSDFSGTRSHFPVPRTGSDPAADLLPLPGRSVEAGAGLPPLATLGAMKTRSQTFLAEPSLFPCGPLRPAPAHPSFSLKQRIVQACSKLFIARDVTVTES